MVTIFERQGSDTGPGMAGDAMRRRPDVLGDDWIAVHAAISRKCWMMPLTARSTPGS